MPLTGLMMTMPSIDEIICFYKFQWNNSKPNRFHLASAWITPIAS